MLQMRLVLKGSVQKVGFRWSVMKHVQEQKLDVLGHVINLPDGSVELIAQGGIEALKTLRRFAIKGPPGADVREFTEDIVDIEDRTYPDFRMG